MAKKQMQVAGQRVRIDPDTGYICITDISKLKGDHNLNIPSWMRTRATMNFVYEWELKHNTNFNSIEFDGIKNQAGDNSFFVYTKDLVKFGCIGIFASAGRYGGTYCAPQWAIHFANWLDARFYLETLDAYLQLRELYLGKDEITHRFSRELAAETYGLITGGKGLERIPYVARPPIPLTHGFKSGNPRQQVARRLSQFDADIINVAVFGMTASMWREKFPVDNPKKNMRDFATSEELKVIAVLQAQMRQLQKEQYSQEEKLQMLTTNAAELLPFFCDTDGKVQAQLKRREERGW
jgi:hypothetical protein